MSEPRLEFRGFEAHPDYRDKVQKAFDAMAGTEAGRLLLSFMPAKIVIFYTKGDQHSRSTSNSRFDYITFVENAFSSPYKTYDTVFHEAIHQIQRVLNLDLALRPLLEGVTSALRPHIGEANFDFVTAPLKSIRTEETITQDLTNLFWEAGLGRPTSDHYYIPGDDRSPPAGDGAVPLTPENRTKLLRLV